MEEYLLKEVHDEFARRMEEQHKRTSRRLELAEKSIQKFTDLTLSVNDLANSMKQMLEEQKQQGKRLEKLEDVPAKNWNTVKVAILTAIGTAIGAGVVAAVINSIT